jgi:hypothetical protein
MKLYELHMGDDGGMEGRIQGALTNLRKNAKSHEDEEVRKACKTGIACLNGLLQRPDATYGGDPHTILRTLSHYDGKLDKNRLNGANDTLSSYSQSDSD